MEEPRTLSMQHFPAVLGGSVLGEHWNWGGTIRLIGDFGSPIVESLDLKHTQNDAGYATSYDPCTEKQFLGLFEMYFACRSGDQRKLQGDLKKS